MNKIKPILRIGLNVITSFSILFLISWILLDWVKNTEQHNIELSIQNDLDLYSDLISQQANLQFAQLEGLHAYTLAQLQHRGEINEPGFNLFAKNLHTDFETIRNLSIAPLGIQTYVYPLEGNENVPGHNLMTDEREDVQRDIQRALESKNIILSGPYQLRQGGLGLVARQAVYLEGQFWGLVTMVLDVPPVIESSNIRSESDFLFAVTDYQGNYFYGTESILTDTPVLSTIHLPDGEWFIAAVPKNGWEKTVQANTQSVRVLVWMIVGLLTLVIASFTSSTYRLQKGYQETKHDLTQNTETLTIIQGELKQREEKILQLTQNAMDCVFSITFLPELTIEYINPIIKELSGYSPEAFYEDPTLFEKIHRDQYGQEIFDLFSPSLNLEKQTREYIWLKKNGQTIWVQEKNVFSHDENGQLSAVEGIARDITAVKEMEFAIRESENKFRQLAETIKEVFWLRDRETGKILYVSPAYESIWGRTTVSLYQDPKSFLESVHPEDVPRVFEANQKLQNENQDSNEEYRIIHPNGEIRWVWSRSFPVYDNQNQVIRYAGIAEDITEIRYSREQQFLINDLSSDLRTEPTPDGMIDLIFEKISSYFKTENIAIVFCKPETNSNLIYKTTGIFKEVEGTHLPVNRGLTAKAINSLKTYWTNDTFSDPHYMEEFKFVCPKTEAVIPLIIESEVFGALIVGKNENLSIWDVKNLEAIANITANALQRAFTYQELLRSVEQLSVLHKIDGVIKNEELLENTIKKIFKIAKNEFLVDRVRLYRYDNQTHFSVCIADTAKSDLSMEKVPSTLLLSENAMLSQKIEIIPNLANYQGFQHEGYQDLMTEGVVWYQAVPLISKSKTIGVLECMHHEPFYPKDNWDSFVDAFADQLVLAFESTGLIEKLKQANIDLTTAYDKTLEGWATALELRDNETKNHSQRVTILSEKIAKKMGIPSSELIHLRRGALLHDIGKIAIPDHILLKPGKLDQEEWFLMRNHPQTGFEMLEKIEYLQPSLDIPLYHHEKFDGSGYPFGLKGEDIPLSARIFALVDVWDALTSDRPYRKAWSQIKAFQYIIEQSGKHFDPAVVRIFRELYLNEENEL
jgi:PAS domain S-box-containing protein/putative nucleotidyltransferase with HDIG domain